MTKTLLPLHTQRTLLCWVAYSCAYFGRINLSAAIPYIQGEYGYSKGELGIVAGGFFVMYAAGQLINGILGDRSSPWFMVALGLLGSGVCNLLAGLPVSLPVFVLIWSVNGYFQSMLWGPIVRTVSTCTPPESLNKAAFLLSTSMPAGYLVSYTATARLTALSGWRVSFLIPGVLLTVIAMLWFRVLRDFPAAPESGADAENNAAQRSRERFLPFALRNGLWLVALLCILQGTVKEGLSLWGPTFVSEALGVSMDRALVMMSLVPVLNFIALLLSARVNRFLAYREKRTLIVFLLLSFAAALALHLTMRGASSGVFPALACLSAALFAANNMLVVFIPMNFQEAGRVSSTAGFIDSAIYLGAAIAGPLLGTVADRSGWSGVTVCWLAACCAGIAIAALSRDYKLINE